VHHRVCYPSWDWQVTKFREEDYTGHFFTHAVKDDQQKIGNKWKMLKVGAQGAEVRIDRNNLIIARRFFSAWAARVVRDAGIADPVFVAIPNRNGIITAQDFKTAFLARTAAQAFGHGATSYTGLRFRVEVPKAQGERQSIQDLVANMLLIEPVPDGTLVMLDDVYTLGRHFTAAMQVLPRKPVLAIVAARTVKEPNDEMLRPGVHDHCY